MILDKTNETISMPIEDAETTFKETMLSSDSEVAMSKVKSIYKSELIEINNSDDSNTSIQIDLYKKMTIAKLKKQVLNLLVNEDVDVGTTSVVELYLEKLLDQDSSQVKEILSLISCEVFDKPEILQKLIEVMSNLDYEKLYPTNTIIALNPINHTDIRVQEAAIAAFEKWDDKSNLKLLRNINYTADWIEDYAKRVIEYLEGC